MQITRWQLISKIFLSNKTIPLRMTNRIIYSNPRLHIQPTVPWREELSILSLCTLYVTYNVEEIFFRQIYKYLTFCRSPQPFPRIGPFHSIHVYISGFNEDLSSNFSHQEYFYLNKYCNNLFKFQLVDK